MRVVLASASPRRKELLKKIFDDFEIIPAQSEEIYPDDIEISKISSYLAEQKANEIFENNQDALVIASDTTVVSDEVMLGKPADEKDAFFMLSMLSGKIHKVITGVCVRYKNLKIDITAETAVEFFDISSEEILEYIKTGEPMDKAGAYGIQGYAAKFVKGIQGDYNNVVGLPVGALYHALKEQGII